MYSRIQLGIAIIKTASSFVRDTPSIFIVPIIMSIILVGFYIFWILGFTYIYSVGTWSRRSVEIPTGTCTRDKKANAFIWYWIFVGIWINAFFQAISEFVIASATCIWYFA